MRQMDILWDFLSAHPEIAKAHNRSLQAKEYSRGKWTELADLLNTQSDGVYKNWRGWSKVTITRNIIILLTCFSYTSCPVYFMTRTKSHAGTRRYQL